MWVPGGSGRFYAHIFLIHPDRPDSAAMTRRSLQKDWFNPPFDCILRTMVSRSKGSGGSTRPMAKSWMLVKPHRVERSRMEYHSSKEHSPRLWPRTGSHRTELDMTWFQNAGASLRVLGFCICRPKTVEQVVAHRLSLPPSCP
jgi:hypothetical protein